MSKTNESGGGFTYDRSGDVIGDADIPNQFEMFVRQLSRSGWR